MIIYGTRTFGRIDEVDDLGGVETKFFHVFWFPLIPMGSMFVFDDDDGLEDNEKHIVKVGFSFKSMFVAWARALGVLLGFGVISGVMMLVEGEEDPMDALIALGVGVIGWAVFFGVGVLARRCSPQRRAELLAMTGMQQRGPQPAMHHQGATPQAGVMAHPHAGYGQPAAYQGWPQGGQVQPGHAQPGHAQPGHAQPGHAQPGHAQPGHMHGPQGGQAAHQPPTPQEWSPSGAPPGQGGYGGPYQG